MCLSRVKGRKQGAGEGQRRLELVVGMKAEGHASKVHKPVVDHRQGWGARSTVLFGSENQARETKHVRCKQGKRINGRLPFYHRTILMYSERSMNRRCGQFCL